MQRLNLAHPGNDTGPNDRGATAVFIALVVVVLIGITAWVIDASGLYHERRELQNGADAAVLAIAADCAVGNCPADLTGTASNWAGLNSSDGVTEATAVTFPNANTVTVDVATEDLGGGIDGDTETVDYQFAQVFGKNGFQVEASATASWGSVGGGGAFPITISFCEFDLATNGGTTYAEAPFGDDTPTLLKFHAGNGPNGPDDCAAVAGQDTDGDDRLPGGFGWLDENDCEAQVTEDGWVALQPGASPANGCNPNDLLNTTLLIPVFDDVTPAGSNLCPTNGPGGKCYHIAGFAAIYVTGFKFPGGQSWRQPSPPPCSGSVHCIEGYFTEFVFENSTGPGENNFGATTIWLVS